MSFLAYYKANQINQNNTFNQNNSFTIVPGIHVKWHKNTCYLVTTETLLVCGDVKMECVHGHNRNHECIIYAITYWQQYKICLTHTTVGKQIIQYKLQLVYVVSNIWCYFSNQIILIPCSRDSIKNYQSSQILDKLA